MRKESQAQRFARARIVDMAETDADEDDGVLRVIAPPGVRKEEAYGFYEARPSLQAPGSWFIGNLIGKTPRGVPLYTSEDAARSVAEIMNTIMRTVGRYVADRSKAAKRVSIWSENVD